MDLKNKLFLAPMAGVTDMPFRLLCREMGADVCCTEMVSAKALMYHNRNTDALLRTGAEEAPTAVQLFGSEPEIMAEQAALLEDRFAIIDVNMGCPVPKIVNNGEGSALMRDPERAYRILSEMTRRVKKPVTVKFRMGFDGDHVNAVEFARMAEAAGVAAVAVHGRTRDQFYSGKADWEIIRRVREAVSVPVIGNGDVFSGADALRMREQTGCDAIMIARGARGNPWIFREARAALAGDPIPDPPTPEERRRMLLRHGRALAEMKGEYTAIREMRKHLAWYTTGLRSSSALRARSNQMERFEEFQNIINEYFRQETL